jgi:hypothetical protein
MVKKTCAGLGSLDRIMRGFPDVALREPMWHCEELLGETFALLDTDLPRLTRMKARSNSGLLRVQQEFLSVPEGAARSHPCRLLPTSYRLSATF